MLDKNKPAGNQITFQLIDIHAQIQGRSAEVLVQLGIAQEALSRHIRCPLPGHDDRHPSFRVDENRGRYYCSCQPGGASLVDLVIACGRATSFKSAANYLRTQLGLAGAARHESAQPPDQTNQPLQGKNHPIARPLTVEAADDQLRRTQLDEAWNACSKLLTHPYLDAKRIPAMEARLHKSGAIAVPIRNRCGQLEGIQMISADGNKRNMPGTRKVGFGLLLGENAADKTLQVVEGWSTGVTVHLLLEKPVLVAFGCDNLLAAAKHFRIEEQPVRICGDNDSDGTGQAAAERAAQALGPRAHICIPPRPGDWNDMYCAYLLRRLDSATMPMRSSQTWRAAA